jgi:hypothetical protein
MEVRKMTDPKSLLDRARNSDDGEAYASIAKGAGFRIGVGGRTARGRDPSLFVEVVLDPFPERPRVNPGRLADQSEIVAWLEARGYLVACDDDGTITCERTVDANRAAEEVQAVKRLLGSVGQGRRTGPGAPKCADQRSLK